MALSLLPANVQPGSPPASPPPADVAKAWKSAREFEAMALGQLLQPMFNTVDTAHSLFGGGAGEDSWKPMMINEIAKKIAANGGLGLARPVMEQMLRLQEARQTDKIKMDNIQTGKDRSP